MFCLRLIALLVVSLSAPLLSESVANEAHARVMFRRANFLGAVLALGNEPATVEGRWILAESLFRLHRYDEAKARFEQVLTESKDSIEQRKLYIRLFDCALRSGNLPQAIASYEVFKKRYQKAPAIMSYGLGKALFDADYDKRALSLLRSVPKDNEFFMRSRYLLAVMDLDTRPAKASLKLFSQIEKMIPLSVEDYSVRELAILAQARLYVDADREELAQAAYERVLLNGPYGETATIELTRVFIAKAESAAYKEGSFAKVSAYSRELSERSAINKALQVIERYRAVKEIDWNQPELHTLMAFLLVKSGRYQEARLAYAELIDHYRPIYQQLLGGAGNQANKIWPCFALDFSEDYLVDGVPVELFKNIVNFGEVIKLKERLQDSGRRLKELELKARQWKLSESMTRLAIVRASHQEQVKAYEDMIIFSQEKIRSRAAEVINQTMAEAEYKRAELALLEMQDLKKQLDAAQNFQTKKIENFEETLKENDKGGSS